MDNKDEKNTATVKVLKLHGDKAYKAKIEHESVSKDVFFFDVYKNA